MSRVRATREVEEEEFPFRNPNKARLATTDTTSDRPFQTQTQTQPITLLRKPVHQSDAETQLDEILDKETPVRDFNHDITTLILPAGLQKEIPPTILTPPQGQSQPPTLSAQTIIEEGLISPHLTGAELSHRPVPGLVPTRRTLPKAPPAAPIESIPVRVMDPQRTAETRGVATKKRGKKVAEKNTTEVEGGKSAEKEIKIEMFHPVIGGIDHSTPSPLQQLPQNAISTAQVDTSTSFPYAPPGPSQHHHHHHHHPQPRPLRPKEDNVVDTEHKPFHRSRDLAMGFLLTDAEFPKVLSRDGPGSRFPCHLVADPVPRSSGREGGRHRGVRRREVPELVLTSPTESSRSVRASALPPTLAMEAKVGATGAAGSEGRVYIAYNPAFADGFMGNHGVGGRNDGSGEGGDGGTRENGMGGAGGREY
ncbi:MAG: hypothetical protein Q9169_002351 [Polycauliona sp. 2 TL-2023]